MKTLSVCIMVGACGIHHGMWFYIRYLEINMQEHQSSRYNQYRGTGLHSDHVINITITT
jgi:hypothetical protein